MRYHHHYHGCLPPRPLVQGQSHNLPTIITTTDISTIQYHHNHHHLHHYYHLFIISLPSTSTRNSLYLHIYRHQYHHHYYHHYNYTSITIIRITTPTGLNYATTTTTTTTVRTTVAYSAINTGINYSSCIQYTAPP